MSKPRFLIFIVAYFAERTIGKVVRRTPVDLLDTYDIEILIIDDSSQDKNLLRRSRRSEGKLTSPSG